MGRDKRYIISAVLAGLLISACQNQATQSNPQGQSGAPGGQVAGTPRVAPTPLPTRVVAASTTVAVDGALALATPLVAATFDASGKVTAVHVKPGQSVKKGDLLAELDDSTLKTAVQKAQENLALKQAQIDSSLAPAKQTDIDVAKASLNSAYAAYNVVKKKPLASDVEAARISLNQAQNSLYSTQLRRDQTCGRPENGPWNPDDEKLAKTDAECKTADWSVQSSEMNLQTANEKYLEAQKPATQDELAKAWSGVVQAQTSLDNLLKGATDEQKKVYELQLRANKVTLERAQRDLVGVKLLSPCDCVVQAVTLSVGAASSGGSVSLLDTAQLKFQTSNLNERDVVKLKAEQGATIRLKAFEQSFTGKVGAILPVSSGTQNSVALYTVLIDLDPTDVKLLPGMTGQAEINLQ